MGGRCLFPATKEKLGHCSRSTRKEGKQRKTRRSLVSEGESMRLYKQVNGEMSRKSQLCWISDIFSSDLLSLPSSPPPAYIHPTNPSSPASCHSLQLHLYCQSITASALANHSSSMSRRMSTLSVYP